MLPRQDVGGHHEGGLAAGLRRCHQCHQGHHCLAGADITLQQAQHALARGHVAQDIADGGFLRAREAVGQVGENH